MDGTRERFERSLRWRVSGKLEEERTKFWTKINAAINEAKSYESDEKRDAEEIRREQQLKDMDMEGRFDYLLGVRRDMRQILRAAERERGDARDRDELIVRKINEARGW